MADIFSMDNAVNLLRGKKILYFGDSNIRSLYKDMLCLLSQNRLIEAKDLKAKGIKSYQGDKLIRGHPLTKGRDYKEDRLFKTPDFHIEYHFISKCLTEDIEEMCVSVKNKRQSPPDIIIMNSTLWDIVRWGVRSVDLFKDNLQSLLRLFKSCLPKQTLVIWVTALPLAAKSYGGFLIQQIEFAKYTMRFDVMEANMFAQQLIASYGYDVIDFHYHLRLHIQWRNNDGIHWSPKPTRHLTNLVLTHVSLAWGVPLPGNFISSDLLKYKALDIKPDVTVKLPTVPIDISGSSKTRKKDLPLAYSSEQQHIKTRVSKERKFNFTKSTSPLISVQENWRNSINYAPHYNSAQYNPHLDGTMSDDFNIAGPSFIISEDFIMNSRADNQAYSLPRYWDLNQYPNTWQNFYNQDYQEQYSDYNGPIRGNNCPRPQQRYAPY